MRKNILRTAVAAVALLAFAGQADAAHVFGSATYSSGNALSFLTSHGSAYSDVGFAGEDTDTATPTVTNTFTLNGSVSKDCSYYGAGTASHTINLGTIGVKTNNDINVSDAFDMNGPAVVNINTATAGCNFNNTVTVAKQNGVSGLKETLASGFDSNQFQPNIPYTINANWVGTTNTGTGVVGTPQSLTVGDNEGSDTWSGGAWRSYFNMLVTVAPPAKALVAGNYTDTITVTLAAS